MSEILCVTNRQLCREDFWTRLDRIAAAGPAGIILREKDLPEADYRRLAERVLERCRRQAVPCILHSFPDAAADLGAEGLHLPLPLLRALPEGKRVKEYSRGMQMKLAIACALAHHPRLLLLDEATSGLDPMVRDEILDLFLDFLQDEHHAIFLSSHIISDIEKAADYVAFLHQGKLLFMEEKDRLREQYGLAACGEGDLERCRRGWWLPG